MLRPCLVPVTEGGPVSIREFETPSYFQSDSIFPMISTDPPSPRRLEPHPNGP